MINGYEVDALDFVIKHNYYAFLMMLRALRNCCADEKEYYRRRAHTGCAFKYIM